ncbi:restriction endonuclease, partial [Listeria innocua]
MKLQYKNQQFQLDAVEAITSIFEGQPRQTNMSYMMDIGKEKNITLDIVNGFKNADISLSDSDLLKNIQATQKKNGILTDNKIVKMSIGGKDKNTKIDNSKDSLTL